MSPSIFTILPHFRKVDWSRESLLEIRKDFYEEDRKVSKRDKSEIKEWLREKEITIEEKGRNKVKLAIFDQNQ